MSVGERMPLDLDDDAAEEAVEEADEDDIASGAAAAAASLSNSIFCRTRGKNVQTYIHRCQYPLSLRFDISRTQNNAYR